MVTQEEFGSGLDKVIDELVKALEEDTDTRSTRTDGLQFGRD